MTGDHGTEGRGLAATICLLSAAAVALFAPVLLGGESFFSRDIAPFFYPMKHHLAASVRSGELPLWNPWIVNGEPFFASLQPGLLYPGSLLLYLLPLPLAFNLLLAAHYPLAGVGMFLVLRRWGHGWAGAALGGLGFMLGGYYVSIGNFPNNLQTVAWAPWLLLAWDRVLMARRIRHLLWFALVCVVAFLGGEPQMLGMILAVLFAHSLLRVERVSGTILGQTALFGLAGVLALALVAVQFIPFVEYMTQSVRSLPVDLEYAASRSLEPRSLVGLVLPPALTGGLHGFTTRYLTTASVPWLLSIYPGFVVLLFASLGAAAPRSRRWLMFWGGVAALGLLLALGRHSLLYHALFSWVPPFRPFRYPEKFYFLTALALPVLAAHGLDRWLERCPQTPEQREARGYRGWTWGLLAVGIGYGAAAFTLLAMGGALSRACAGWLQDALLCSEAHVAQQLYARQSVVIVLLLALLAAVTGLYRRGWLRPVPGAALVLAVAAVDLLAAHRSVNPSVPGDVYTQPPWVATVLDGLGDEAGEYRFRGSPHIAAMGSIVTVRGAWELTNMYLDYQTMGPNVGQMFGHAMQDGLQGVELETVALSNEAAMRAWGEDPIRFLRAMNVRYYADATVEADALPALRLIAVHPELPIRVFEVPDPLPRAYLVPAYEVVDGPQEALRRVLARRFPLGRRVVLEREPGLRPDAGATGEIIERSYGSNRVSLRVRTDGPMLLVLNDRYYPGWRASLRDHGVPLLRANGVFRAVSVPTGESEIVFRFSPLSLHIGGWISLAGLFVFLFLWRQSRRRRA
jgi:hypothetical protein